MTTARIIQDKPDVVTGDAFLDAEASSESSEPRELVRIVRSDGVTHHHTSASRDIVYEGNVYRAIPIQRGEIAVTMPGEEKDLVLALPIDHPLCRRYTQQGVPPKRITCTIYRQNGGVTEQIWVGEITSMSAERGVAKFRVPSRAGEWMLRRIPTATVGRQCPHILYSAPCGVDRNGSHGGLAHKVATTVISVSGRDVTVDLGSTSRNGTWAEQGEVLHVGTTERMTVGRQTDLNPGTSAVARLTMQMQIVGMKVGDAVEIYRGCAHTIAACHSNFGNRDSFGGFPAMPTSDPFIPAGTGTEGL